MSGNAMKILIAVKSCHRDIALGFNQIVRDTWGRDFPVTFFVGRGQSELADDEVMLDCPDEYLDLPAKVRTILAWALWRGYDFVFLCDTDSYVAVDQLLSSGFEDYDYVGNFNGELGKPKAVEGAHYAWTSGGDGYWLSRKATEIVATAPEPTDWAEDKITGQLLGPLIASGEIKAKDDKRYADFPRNTDPATGDWKVDISLHYCCHGMGREYDSNWMRAVHERVMAGLA